MSSQIEISENIANLKNLLRALEDIAPNRFFNMINEAQTARELFDAALELEYAANSKELRDTGDERVHVLAEKIRTHTRNLASSFTIKLFPSSPEQKQSWKTTASIDPSGKHAFRDDDSLEISIIDSHLHESTLYVKRVWSHVSSVGGSTANFKIKLNTTQIKEFKARSVEPRLVQIAIPSHKIDLKN